MKKLLADSFALASISFALAAVNVNTATQTELESLNGIGPVKSRAIIDYRTKNGPFKSIEELDKVPGQGTINRIKNDVTLSGKTTIAEDAKAADRKEAGTSKEQTKSAAVSASKDDNAKSA